MQIFLFFALFISVLAVIFAIQNNAPATVSFVVWEYHGSLALILLVTLAAGALISFFFSLPSNIRTRWAIRQQRKKMNEMETNLADLRAQIESTQKELAEKKEPEKPAVPVAPVPDQPAGQSDIEQDEESDASPIDPSA